MEDQQLDFIRDELVKAMRFAEQGKHKQAVDVCARCLKSAEQKAVPLPEGFMGALLTRMGLSLSAQGDLDTALENYWLAEGVLLRRQDAIREVRARYNIALYSTDDDLRLLLADIYQALGQSHDARSEPDRAIEYYKRAFKMAQTIENIGLAWRALNTMALNYQNRGLWVELKKTADRMVRLNESDPQATREIVARRYLAQALGKTGCTDEMVIELERIVAIGRENGHPDVKSDERALARAQQLMLAAGNETAQPVSIVTVDTEQSVVAGVASAIVSVPGTGTLGRPNPTPPEMTELPPDLIQGIQIEMKTERGAREVVFVLQTRYPERAATLFQLFRLTLLPVSITSMQQLGDSNVTLPRGGQIFVEWSLHDLMPNALIHSLVIPESMHDQLEHINRETRRLTVYLESKEGPFGKRKRVPLPGLFDPYVLDWRGITGVVRYLRRQHSEKHGRLTEQAAHHLVTLLEMPVREGFPATGIYREMGVLYRMVKNYPAALQCFRDEIAFNLGKDGVPSVHAAQAFRQLGLVFQEQNQTAKAYSAFMAALAINPNSFDTLTAIANTITDASDAFRFLGRAYRIRKNDPAWLKVMEDAAERFNRTVQQVEQAVAIVATQVDLTSRFDLDRSALVRLGII